MKILIAISFMLIPYLLFSQSLERLQLLLHHSFSEVSNIDVQRAQARIDLQRRQNGLRFNNTISNNEFAGIEFGDNWRLLSGISLELLKDGYFENKNEAKVLEIEKKIAQKELEHQALDKNYSYLFNYIIFEFNKEKNLLLRQKKFVLESLLNKNYNLYYNHELNYEEILYLEGLQEEANIIISGNEHLNKLFENLVDLKSIPGIQVNFLPILEFDLDALMERNPFEFLDEMANLKKERINYTFKKYQTNRLSIYANLLYRPNLSDSPSNGVYNNFGIRYNTRLTRDKDERQNLIFLEKERIDAINKDLVFNQNKELINLVLEHNTKIRQYSNFLFKLKNLREKGRVESAVQVVSTINIANKNHWKNELEILNVQYELLELKQLLYLSLIRIYNNGKLTELAPYVKEKTFENHKNRFDGNRIINIVESKSKRYQEDFIVNYLVKNDFKHAFWEGEGLPPEELIYKFYTHGIQFIENEETITDSGIISIPVGQFSNRSDMELWIEEQLSKYHNEFLFFENIEDLILLDTRTIGE